MKDLISIIVPFLNSEKTLDKCIKSILNQTVDNYEIILIDNSSTDKSKNIATSYSQKYNFIKYYNIKKRSVSAARNKGLSEAKGNLICFVDSDDYISKKYLEIMYKELINNDLVICNFTSNSSKVNDKIDYVKKIDNNNIFNLILKDKKIRGYVWNKLFKKEIIEKNNIKFNENLVIGEDIDFVFHYLRYCNNISFINSNLYYYNLNSNNTVNNIDNYKYALDGWINLFDNYKKYNKDYKNMDLINYFYLKKYYEIKYYDKKIKKSNKMYFSDKYNLNYKVKLFIYKYFTPLVIISKKIRRNI